MCQLLGMNGNTPTDIVFSFTGFSTRAEEHKDGFGIAFFEDRGVRLLVGSPAVKEPFDVIVGAGRSLIGEGTRRGEASPMATGSR